MPDDILASIWRDLIGRLDGPMKVRCIVQPSVAIALAIRAGRRDAREGRPPFLWTLLWMPGQRNDLLRQAWRDIGKVFIIAVVMDVIYQVFVLSRLAVDELMITATTLAIVPYFLVRGPVSRVARMLTKRPLP